MTPGPLAATLAVVLASAPPTGARPSDRSIGPGAVDSVVVSVRLFGTGPEGQVIALAPGQDDRPRPEGPARARKVELGCHGSSACRRLIALGATAGGLGLAAIASGIVLLARPSAVDPEDPTSLVTYRPAGAALLAIGGGLAATWLLTLLAARKAGQVARRLQARVPSR